MAWGRTTARGDRRRRVLTEELLAAPSDSPAVERNADGQPEATTRPRYTDLVARQNRARLTDVVPQRPIAVCGLLALVAAAVAGLTALGLYRAQLASAAAFELPALEMARVGRQASATLAAWFASLALFGSSQLALVIFSVRRHRLDDYHGRYRIWLWAAVGCLLASLHVTTGLAHTAAEVFARATGWGGEGPYRLAWNFPVTLLIGFIVLRVLVDVRESRPAFVAVTLATSLWLLATFAPLDTLPLGPAAERGMLAAAVAVASCGLLLVGLALYGRHVVLEADGRVPAAKRPASKPAQNRSRAGAARARPTRKAHQEDGLEKTAASGGRTSLAKAAPGRARTDLDEDSQKPPPAARKHITEWTDGSDGAEDPHEDGDDGPQQRRKISKSERKRLRKLKQQVRRAA